jgi:hypothetical protein
VIWLVLGLATKYAHVMARLRLCHIAAVALLIVVPASADAKVTVRITGLKAHTGASAGAPISITPTVTVAGRTARVRLTAKLLGKRNYALKGVGSRQFTGRKVVAFAPIVPRNAHAGSYALSVCVTSQKQAAACRTLTTKVRVLTLTVKPKPLTAARTLDAARAATATIGPAGGTLATTAADGAVARVRIPPKALAAPTQVTMTPVTKIDGHPAKPGVLAGVQLAPDGLQLAVAAELELKPTVRTKAAQRTVLTGDTDGTNTRPEVFKDAGDGAKVALLHFSSYELAYVPFGDLRAQRAMLDWSKFPPGPNIEQLTARLAEKLGAARERQLATSKGDVDRGPQVELGLPIQAEINALLEAYYSGQVLPQLLQAKGNCEVAPLALSAAFAWQKLVELSGRREAYAAEIATIDDLARQIIRAGLVCLHKRCVQDNYPEAFEDYLHLYSRAELLAITPPYTVSEELRRCLRFKVEIESALTIPAGANLLGGQRSGPGYLYQLRGEGVVPEPGLGAPFAKVPVLLDYSSFSGSTTDFYAGKWFACTDARLTEAAAHGNPGTVTVDLGSLTIRHDAAQTARDFVLRIDAGDTYGEPGFYGGPFETYGNTSTGGGEFCVNEPSETAGNRWARVFDAVGARDTTTNAPGAPARPYQLAGFTRATKPVFLQRSKRDTGNVGGWDYDITTTIRIVHTPIRVG